MNVDSFQKDTRNGSELGHRMADGAPARLEWRNVDVDEAEFIPQLCDLKLGGKGRRENSHLININQEAVPPTQRA